MLTYFDTPFFNTTKSFNIVYFFVILFFIFLYVQTITMLKYVLSNNVVIDAKIAHNVICISHIAVFY